MYKPKNKEKYTYYEHEKQQIDSSGNTISDQRTFKRKIAIEDEFIKLYYKRILCSYITPTGSFDTLVELLVAMADDITYASTDTKTGKAYEQMIAINKVSRKKYAERLGVSDRRIYQMVNELVDAKLIRRVTRGYYAVNPYIIGKGKWKDIVKIREVWSANEFGEVQHDVITEQADEDDNIRITQTTQRNNEEPTTQTIEQPSYTQTDIFGNDHNFDHNGKEIS